MALPCFSASFFSVSLCPIHSSLHSQRLHRINRGRPPRRHQTRQRRRRHQQQRHARQNPRIPRTLRHPLRRHLIEREAQQHSRRHSAAHIHRRGSQHNTKHVARSGPQRHAYTKLIGSRGHSVGHHAIQPHCRQRQRQHRKNPKQCRHQPLLRIFLLARNPPLQIANTHYLLLRIDLRHLCAHITQYRKRRHSRAHQNLREHHHVRRKRDV